MRNKHFILFLFFLTFFTLKEAVADSTRYYTSGFYAGTALGYSHMIATINNQMINPAGPFEASSKATHTDHGIAGTLILGYRHLWTNGILLGLEVGAGRDNNTIKKTSVLKDGIAIPNVSILRSSYQLTASLVLGTQFSERWLGVVKIGASRRKFYGSHMMSFPGDPDVIDSFTKTSIGFMGDLGAEYAFTKNISGIFDVSYEHHKSFSLSFKKFFNDVGEVNSGSLSPFYGTAKLGILYRF